jgi:hypothetical protein
MVPVAFIKSHCFAATKISLECGDPAPLYYRLRAIEYESGGRPPHSKR